MPSINLAIGAGNQAGGLYEANILNVSRQSLLFHVSLSHNTLLVITLISII